MNIDKWAADSCGVETHSSLTTDGLLLWTMTPPYHRVVREWTIQDPRCREIFRAWWIKEHTGTVTFCLDGKVRYDSTAAFTHIIRDNELACIKAIWESSDNE